MIYKHLKVNFFLHITEIQESNNYYFFRGLVYM